MVQIHPDAPLFHSPVSTWLISQHVVSLGEAPAPLATGPRPEGLSGAGVFNQPRKEDYENVY